MFDFYDKWSGLIPLLGGVYCLYFFCHSIPQILKNPKAKNREKLELYQRKFGKMMKILSPLIIIFGIWQLADGLTGESTSKYSVEFRKKFHIIKEQAGEPDASGWIPAYSTNGGFFIYMPAPFDEIELPPTEIDGEKKAYFGMVTNIKEIKVSAEFLKYQNGISDIETYKKTFIRKHKWSRYFTRIEETFFDNKYPLLEIEIKTPEFEHISQTIITHEGKYVLTVEYKKVNERNLALARRFFDSFKIINP